MRRGVPIFALKVLLIYAILVLIPWPGLHDGYAAWFRAGGRALFTSFGTSGRIALRALLDESGPWDTQLRLINEANAQAWTMKYSAWRTGYLPTAALLSLILATPVPWPRRVWALIFGLILVHGFIALRVAIAAVRWFREVKLFAFGGFGNWLADLSYEVVSVSTVTSCVAAALIWLAVTFLPSDWVARPLRRQRAGSR